MRNYVEFLLNGEPRRLSDFSPTLTVMRYLRETEKLTGTKEGCAEGDCGACTAVVAALDENGISYRAINSCIVLVGTLDRKALVTVEYLGGSGGLHPVQLALLNNDASQCGFCTPGFAMSLFAGCHNEVGTDRQAIDTLLAGNLCRCTGYTSILAASKQVLLDPSGRKAFDDREPLLIDYLRRSTAEESIRVDSDGKLFLAPADTVELLHALKAHPNATLVAGGTDVGLFVTKQHRSIRVVIDLGKVQELKALSLSKVGLRLGATVTYARAHKTLSTYYPAFLELIRRLGSVQVRNLGTIGGNIANGSPIGDMPPSLIAANARLRLLSLDGARDIPLEDYFIAYGKQDRRQAEIVESIFIPAPKANSVLKIYKISKRFDQDISAVCVAFNIEFDEERRRIRSARICFGGMAGTPVRSRACEKFLAGKEWTEAIIRQAAEVVSADLQPLSDLRATETYRRKVAANLLVKCFHEISQSRSLQLPENRKASHEAI